ncbi:putative bifunctional diguanylate cyclase/phosphodiesterase [Thalassotalea ganghwensis]
MASLVKPYLKRASIVAGATILMGLVLSVIVFNSSDQVKVNTEELVEQRLPVLISIKELMADLVEQERIIYEYYSDQNHEVFLSKSAEVNQNFNMHLGAIRASQKFPLQLTTILSSQQTISELFEQFHQLMLIQDDNWDEMRDVLSQISQTRRELMPTLLFIEQETQTKTQQTYQSTIDKVMTTHWLVGVFALVLLIVAAIVSWYVRQYILTQAKTTRLAMFSHANPNPIISVSNTGEVVFHNPASEKMAQRLGFEKTAVNNLLPSNFTDLRQKIGRSKSQSIRLEQTIGKTILQSNIYWHQSLDAYDIHIHDITQQKLAEQEVLNLAFTHQETQLANNYQFKLDVENLLAQSKSLAIGIIEIRQFNETLSTLGLDAATSLMRSVAKLMDKCLPPKVKLYHLNQQQFAVVLTSQIEHLALQKLTKDITMATQRPLVTSHGEFFAELDFGFARFPEHGNNANELIKNAHTALSLLGQQDHENFMLFDAEQAQHLDKNQQLLARLRNAVALDELYLTFQPQLSLQTNQVVGVETLVRWEHQGQVISPVDFIPLAEQSGLIVEIGHWILVNACLLAKQLIDEGLIDIVVAVNISARQFSHPQFCHSVSQALANAQLPAKNLELEITEGVFLHNEQNTIEVLNHLKKMGLSLSIDDFGTGYSSLSYLKQFPVDKLKIDQSFIRESHTNDEDKAIVNTIISLGKNLGLTLIAEGVEEQVHVDFLKKHCCDEIQGYWFSKPLREKELMKFLQERIPQQSQTHLG